MQIGELAKLTNTSTKTIRFYEDCGLIAPARSGRSSSSSPTRSTTIERAGFESACSYLRRRNVDG